MSEQKRKDRKRNGKNEMKYMQNDSTRRSTFSKRGEAMVLMVNDVFSLGFALTSKLKIFPLFRLKKLKFRPGVR